MITRFVAELRLRVNYPTITKATDSAQLPNCELHKLNLTVRTLRPYRLGLYT